MSSGLSTSAARAALETFDAAERAVEAESRRRTPALLTAWSALVVVDYAAKDHVDGRWARHGISTACAVATLALAGLESRTRRVEPLGGDPDAVGLPAAVPFVGAMAVWAVAERLVVSGLRRSRLRRPNTVAGALLALTRPAGYVLLLRLAPTPERR